MTPYAGLPRQSAGKRWSIVLGAPMTADLAQPDRGGAQVAQRRSAELGAGVGAVPGACVGDRGKSKASQRGQACFPAGRADLNLLTGEAREIPNGHGAQISERQVCGVDIGVGSHPNLEICQGCQLEREPKLASRGAVRGTR